MPIEDDIKIRNILKDANTIAVVGASSKLYRNSYHIAKFLKNKGYKVFFVNPKYVEIEGDKCYANLRSIDQKIDIVDVFRNPNNIDEIFDDPIAVKAKTLWLQLGVVNNIAASKAESNGIQVVMDHCIAIDYVRLIR